MQRFALVLGAAATLSGCLQTEDPKAKEDTGHVGEAAAATFGYPPTPHDERKPLACRGLAAREDAQAGPRGSPPPPRAGRELAQGAGDASAACIGLQRPPPPPLRRGS